MFCSLDTLHDAKLVDALIELLKDSDYNIRTVAASALSHSGSGNTRVLQALEKGLHDKDRLVRESSCLALGHLKDDSAVPTLLQLWSVQ